LPEDYEKLLFGDLEKNLFFLQKEDEPCLVERLPDVDIQGEVSGYTNIIVISFDVEEDYYKFREKFGISSNMRSIDYLKIKKYFMGEND
jgi:predicted RNA-binding protein with PUA domain